MLIFGVPARVAHKSSYPIHAFARTT